MASSIQQRFDILQQQTEDFLNNIDKLKQRKITIDAKFQKPPIPARDLEKERITELKSARNKAIIFAAALITCIAINILLIIFLPVTQKILFSIGFGIFYYFLTASLISEIKDYKNLKKGIVK